MVVRVFIKKRGGSWTSIGDLTVDEDGYYSYIWEPSLGGTYQIVTVLLDEDGEELVPSSTETLMVEEQSGGIPGFPVLSLIIGALLAVLSVLKKEAFPMLENILDLIFDAHRQ